MREVTMWEWVVHRMAIYTTLMWAGGRWMTRQICGDSYGVGAPMFGAISGSRGA